MGTFSAKVGFWFPRELRTGKRCAEDIWVVEEFKDLDPREERLTIV